MFPKLFDLVLFKTWMSFLSSSLNNKLHGNKSPLQGNHDIYIISALRYLSFSDIFIHQDCNNLLKKCQPKHNKNIETGA